MPASTFRICESPPRDGETIQRGGCRTRRPRAQIVYWHGNGGNLSLWLDAFAALHEQGWSVLAFDYRGYGASTGRPSERGQYRDTDAVLAYFTRHLRAALHRHHLTTIILTIIIGARDLLGPIARRPPPPRTARAHIRRTP